MENNCDDFEIEEKLLINSLLFIIIRKNKTPETKIKRVQNYLDRGADINTTDANDKNNTPLHVAVMKGDPEVVSFLLERGALVNKINNENQTALDFARLLDKSTKKREDIVTTLKAFTNNQQDVVPVSGKGHPEFTQNTEKKKNIRPSACHIDNQTQSNDVTNGSSVKSRNEVQNKPNKEMKKTKGNKLFHYQKRSGTSGLSGQLYETKLLSLILFRALYVQEIKTFLIATNVESMGAFDDIIFRFYSNIGDKPKIMFVQAKHRDNPAKDRFTVEEILKLNGDFSLQKYLESYIKISQMFVPENRDDMFRGEFKKMDCEFIIYTSAFEKFSKMKPVKQSEGKRFINTTKGKVFQFDYDKHDVDILVQTVAKSRAVRLAKRLSKFIFKDNHSNMMMDDLIKTYHVFLARHVLAVDIQDGEMQNNFRNAKFRETLFSSNDNLLLAFKATICTEVLLLKKIMSSEKLDEVMSVLMSLTFKVPMNFGNLNFSFSGSEQKKEKKLEYLCSKFKQLFEKERQKAIANLSENIVMKVDDNMIGPNEILQSTDLESYRLGGLVGNLLVIDDETKTLKLNSDINTLSMDNLKLYEKLKNEVYTGVDVGKCRFDINVQCFPRLSLIHDEYDRNLISDFLGKLIFYTNQATEEEVERILKKEIDEYFVRKIPRQNDALFRVKGDAIFLKIHDCVQKWWKQPINAPYLTESCEYFFEAEQDLLNSPLLSILNFTYTKTIKNALPELRFKNAALELLHLDDFFSGPDKILSITTKENSLSSIKLVQYFKEKNINDYTFIDLDYVGLGNYFVDVKTEINKSKINTVIVVCKGQDLVAEIQLLINNFKGKIITICNRDLTNQINGLATEGTVERVDSQIGFNDLVVEMRTILLEKRYIMFQGKEVPLCILFEDKSYHLINSNVLHEIIKNEKIAIGSCFNNPAYDEMSEVYINTSVCRFVTLDPNIRETFDITTFECNKLEADFKPDMREIVLITDKDKEFTDFIGKHKNCNVHWFISYKYKCKEYLVWQKSRGNLLKLLKYIYRSENDAFTLQPVTLKDLKERVVVISGEPGTGKSFLLTHLAINTKNDHPALWISKINLLEITDELRRMKNYHVNIDLKDAVQFLFRVVGFKAYKENKAELEAVIDEVFVSSNISFKKNLGETNLTGSNLFEIELFIHCYNNDRVVLLFDGFDEICPDFANEFMQLVNVLKKSKVVHMCITSRLYNVLHQLENTLETFSFTIKSLHENKQIKFLRKLLLRKIGTKLDYDRVRHFYSGIERIVKDTDFLRVPLHLYMISELFQDSFLNNYPRQINLSEVYERFIDVKFFKIRFGEKKPLLCMYDPDIRKLIDDERAAFLYVHKIMAAYVIFGQSDEFFDNHEINAIYDFIEKIKVGEEKTGMIEQIIQNKPKFIQYTFAEYFAAEFLCDKLKSCHCKRSVWKYLIYFLSQYEKTRLVQFFNTKLENQLMFNEIYKTDLNELFENLLLEHQQLSKTLFKMICNGVEKFAIIIFKIIKAVLNKENLNDFVNVLTSRYYERCLVCNLVTYGAKDVISVIIKLIKNIDDNRLIDLFNCFDLPKSNPLAVPDGFRKKLCSDVGLLNVLLSDLTPPNLVDLFTQQLIFYEKYPDKEVLKSKKLIIYLVESWLLGDIDVEWFDKFLEKFNWVQLMTIFSAQDAENRSVVHIAAIKTSYTFFEKLDSLLDRSQFKELCMARDSYWLTPIHYFRHDCKKRKNLLAKVYDSYTKEKFVSRDELMNDKVFKKNYYEQLKKNTPALTWK